MHAIDAQQAAPQAAPDSFHEALADRLSARLSVVARYVASWNRWMLFDGRAWRPDETLRVFSHARAICRAAAQEAGDKRDKARIGSAAMVAAIERLARADSRHTASADQWDADPWLLNTPAGTIDLRTGALRPHRRDDHITRSTAVAPDGDCPLFRAFLARIFAGDEALIRFVQRALGYALTGVTSEHALFFAHGTGGNGKSVLLNAVLRVLGGYATVAPLDGFIDLQGDRHAVELAMLRGARFVIAPETEPDAPWSERRLKALTGGDPVKARPARGESFLYWPCFKLFMAGNRPPAIRMVDEAIRRRLHLIPFAVTIPAAEVDRDLPRKLADEGPGILTWMIAGCREWQRIGLAPPPAVVAATADHLAEEDSVAAWAAEWLRQAPESASETTADLFASWAAYARAAHEPVGSKKAFAQAMRARGFAPCRTGKAGSFGFQGVRLRPSPADEPLPAPAPESA